MIVKKLIEATVEDLTEKHLSCEVFPLGLAERIEATARTMNAADQRLPI
jgi:hypothetical protein